MQSEDTRRLQHPNMEYFRYVYRNSIPLENLKDLKDKTVIVYGEQGFGDTIQFARYLPPLMDLCHVIFHCRKELHRLFSTNNIGHEWLDRDCPDLPPHDFYVPSMSLPFYDLTPVPAPYLKVTETVPVDKSYFNIGIAWEGSPTHSNNNQRSCSLSLFQKIHDQPNTRLYLLQNHIHSNTEILPEFQLYSTVKQDFYDTATLIQSMDMIITVDTAILHLAGAMNQKNVFGILSVPGDARWDIPDWYPDVTLLKDYIGDWSRVFQLLLLWLKSNPNVQIRKVIRKTDDSTPILITGGIGDFIALESHMSESYKEKVARIYLSTRASSCIKKLIDLIFYDVDIVEIIADYKNTTFYNKNDVSSHMKQLKCPLPSDWERTEDWSISIKFPQIIDGLYPFCGSSLLEHVETFRFIESDYFIICPSTDTEIGTGRDFDENDWQYTIDYLEKNNKMGVVIAGYPVLCPDNKYIIDYSGKSQIFETIGILKGAIGYVGIDSFISVLISQLFHKDKIMIKSINKHFYRSLGIYCPRLPKKKLSKNFRNLL